MQQHMQHAGAATVNLWCTVQSCQHSWALGLAAHHGMHDSHSHSHCSSPTHVLLGRQASNKMDT